MSAGISHPGKADEYMPGSQVGSQAGKTTAIPAVAALAWNSHKRQNEEREKKLHGGYSACPLYLPSEKESVAPLANEGGEEG